MQSILLIAFCLPALTCAAGEADSPGNDAPTILIDAVHANDFSLLGLRPHVYSYHQNQGFRRGFEYLESRGFSRDLMVDGRLTPERLSDRRLLFLNLVSAERPPFLVSEIEAVCRFVASGGSLFIITDHTNCYYHAYRLQPLFVELGLATFTATACEEPPLTLGDGNGWIAVRRFKEHPITIGLECLGMLTGGCVDPRYAVALTSPQSWADEWSAGLYGEENAPGFYGNFHRDAHEPAGPLGIVLAKELGNGRIVVVADQNIFGDIFINYADNYRLWLNAMAWLLRDDSVRPPDPYERSRSPRILLYEHSERPAFGTDSPDGYYHAMAFLNRYYWTFANSRLTGSADLIVLARDEDPLDNNELEALCKHLRRGRNLLVLSADGSLSGERDGVVRRLSAALGQSVSSRGDTGGTVLQLAAGGRVEILPSDLRVKNDSMAPPSVPPSETERDREQRLLDAMNRLLPSPVNGPAATVQTPGTP